MCSGSIPGWRVRFNWSEHQNHRIWPRLDEASAQILGLNCWQVDTLPEGRQDGTWAPLTAKDAKDERYTMMYTKETTLHYNVLWILFSDSFKICQNPPFFTIDCEVWGPVLGEVVHLCQMTNNKYEIFWPCFWDPGRYVCSCAQCISSYCTAYLDAKLPVKVDQVSQDRLNAWCFNRIWRYLTFHIFHSWIQSNGCLL